LADERKLLPAVMKDISIRISQISNNELMPKETSLKYQVNTTRKVFSSASMGAA